MKLPNLSLAAIPQAKIEDYLLSLAHPRGRTKAAFFCNHGFTRAGWVELAQALLQHAAENHISTQSASAFGIRYVVDGFLRSPAGKRLHIRATWFIDHGQVTPRFVTAYPCKHKRKSP